MSLLWYRDPADGLLKPYAVPGDELSFSHYVVAPQSVPAGSGWVPLAAPTTDPTGDHAAAFGVGTWIAPTSGVWQVEVHAVFATGNMDIALRIASGLAARVSTSPANATGTAGSVVVWTQEHAAGAVLDFFVRHNSASAQNITLTVSATRLRRFTPSLPRAAEGGEFVSRNGDTMLGPLVLSDDPVLALGAATKRYADDRVVNAFEGTDTTRATSQNAVRNAVNAVNARTIGAGAGLTGGGRIDASPTLNVGAGSGITVSADAVAVNFTTLDARYPKVTVSATAPSGPKVGDIWVTP